MFNLLISGNVNAWETDQLMRMDAARFNNEYSGIESSQISAENPGSLQELEKIPSLLLYERGSEAHADIVRFGFIRER